MVNHPSWRKSFRGRLPWAGKVTSSTADLLRSARREKGPSRAHTGGTGCLCWPCEQAARFGPDAATEERIALADEQRAEEESC